MFAARTVGRLDYLETIEEMDRELTKVIEDFDRAVDVEALRLAKRSSKHSFSPCGNAPGSVVARRSGSRARIFA